jgi:hypothetical protein
MVGDEGFVKKNKNHTDKQIVGMIKRCNKQHQ